MDGYLELLRTSDGILDTMQVTHGLFRLDPGATALTPSRAIEHPHFDIQLASSLKSLMKDVPPFFRHGFYRTFLGTLSFTNHTDLYAVDTCFFHGMKVFDYSFFRHVASYPIPVHG